MQMNALMKPVAAMVIAATAATSFAGVAEAKKWRNHNAGKLLLGLGLGLAVGGILSNSHRRNQGVYHSTYDDDGYYGCYRSERVVCDTRWVCHRKHAGYKVCREKESCYRPLICD